tara:strand:+ start:17504 stop:17917 length:414 start_codon:yes stop_codon:yes gene_type:complete
MTLLELLIALSIFAAIATLSGVALSGSLAHLRHQRAAELLVSDLRRASLTARSLGQETHIRLSPEGYAIDALGVERVWPRDVTALWRVREAGNWQIETRLSLPPRMVASPEVQVDITRGTDRITVRIDRVTGRVHAG